MANIANTMLPKTGKYSNNGELLFFFNLMLFCYMYFSSLNYFIASICNYTNRFAFSFKQVLSTSSQTAYSRLSGYSLTTTSLPIWIYGNRLIFRYDRKNPRLLFSSRSTLTIHIWSIWFVCTTFDFSFDDFVPWSQKFLIYHRSSYHYRADLHKEITLLCRLTGWITLIFWKLYMVYFNEL